VDIEDIPNAVVPEGEPFSYQVIVVDGTLPITFSLQNQPQGMTINSSSGLITWNSAIASNNPYQITVVAQNVLGIVTKSWALTVDISFSVSLRYISFLFKLKYQLSS
jgi:hypothetical protein